MRLRSVVVTTQPTVEPVSLTEAKAQLSLLPEQTDDDALIVGLIAAARRLVERRLGLALAPQQLRARYELDGDGWRRAGIGGGPSVLELPIAPVLTGSTYPVVVDLDGVAVSSSTYSVDSDSLPGFLRFLSAPTVLDTSTLTVSYWAGPTGRIPPQLRAAILLYVGHLYAHREAVSTERAEVVPMAFETLLASESVTGRW
jgi:uncharacterized phiE125 gp8 family phage protein